MRVLVACEFSGIVRDAFQDLGHDAWSCDVLPTERSGCHIRGDVLDILDDGWDLLIAHPPCTYLCNSGVCWLYEKNSTRINQSRWQMMEDAAIFFHMLLHAPIEKIAVENPIMHRYAKAIVGCNYSQIVQPYEHGDGQQKATCLWLRGLPKITPTKIVSGRSQRLHWLWPSPTRWVERSRTFPGIAAAMAAQWGSLDQISKGESDE